MTQRKKITMTGIVLMAALIVLSVILPVTYQTTVKMTWKVPVNVSFNAVSDMMTLAQWYHKLEGYTLKEPEDWSDIPLSQNEYTYAGGVVRLISSAINDSVLLYDEGVDKRTSKLKFKFSEEKPDYTSLQVTVTEQSGLFVNLFHFILKWKLHRRIKADLSRLKLILEDRFERNTYFGYEVKSVSVPEKFYITRRDSILADNLVDYYKQNVSLLYQAALNDNLAIHGMPVVLIYERRPDGFLDVAVGLPTLSEVNLRNSSVQLFPVGTAFQIVHEGQSMHTHKAHKAMMSFFHDREMQYIFPLMEEYPAEITENSVTQGQKTFIIYYPKF